MPLDIMDLVWRGRTQAKGLTMSSGSSGKRVIVPEPSLSISCLMRRIVYVVWNSMRQRIPKRGVSVVCVPRAGYFSIVCR